MSVYNIAIFTGHMIDSNDRHLPRFPAWLENSIQAHITQAITQHHITIGYSSAACGGDLLFIEALIKQQAEVHIILPFCIQDFINTSLAYAGKHWITRFHQALTDAHSISYVTTDSWQGDNHLFQQANDLMQHQALTHAQQLDLNVIMLSLLELQDQQAVGGTQDNVKQWLNLKHPHYAIDIKAIREQASIDNQ
jgi:hypothetical protein